MATLRVSQAEGNSPLPNPDLLKKDPMAELFGPGSGLKLVGEEEDSIPDEVRSVLDEYGLSKTSFQCQLKEIPDGANGDGGSTNASYIKGFVRSIPSIEYIARNYGPGNYLLNFTWRSKNEDNVSKAMRQEVPIVISKKFMEEYKKHRLQNKIEEASQLSTQVRDTMIEKNVENQMLKALTGEEKKEDVNPVQTAKQYISDTMETIKMLGIPIGHQPLVAPRAFEWDKILPAAIAGITAFMQMQQQAAQVRSEEFNKMLMMMMSQGKDANSQLIEIMKVQQGAGSGNLAIREFKDMVLGAIDIKEALNGGVKETVADRIFKVVEGVAPQILNIAANAAQAQAMRNSMPVKMAKGFIANDPDFQAVKKDPIEMQAFINKMDNFFGWEQTDVILAVSDWERPDVCPRDPAKQKPPVMGSSPTEAADEIAE